MANTWRGRKQPQWPYSDQCEELTKQQPQEGRPGLLDGEDPPRLEVLIQHHNDRVLPRGGVPSVFLLPGFMDRRGR